jgi:hypothetical protein
MRCVRAFSVLAAFALGVLLTASSAQAQFNNGFIRQIGGVSISTKGVVGPAAATDVKLQRAAFQKELAALPAEAKGGLGMRMISLRSIEQALAGLGPKETTLDLPVDVRFLAGIQRVQYIFVYPEQQDIVLAGPGEAIVADEKGNVIGVSTGKPVLRLDDLIVAFRSVDAARQGGLACSIDPTAEGRKRLDSLLREQKVFNPAIVPAIEKTLGPQVISLFNVPEGSRLGGVLVGADWKMKRIAMGLEPSPLKELPSFLDMLKSSRMRADNMMPRWWIACNYDPIAKDASGLAWEIRGKGGKVMTEEDMVAEDGSVKGTGKANPIAQKWADAMTANYAALAAKEPIFAELQNAMDLCVAAAIIAKENLAAKADCQLVQLAATEGSQKGGAATEVWETAKSVETKSSFIKRGSDYIITASGGVSIESWAIADKTQVDEKLAGPRAKLAEGRKDGIWWKAN